MSIADTEDDAGPVYDPYATGSLSGGPPDESAGGMAAAAAADTAPVYTDPYAVSTTPTAIIAPGYTAFPSATAAPASERTEETSTWPYLAPTTGVYSSGNAGYFGARRPLGREHSGGDWGAPVGTPATASIGGPVVGVHYSAMPGGYGHYADVLGDDGNIFRYATHREITVEKGQRVERGDQIGTIGVALGGQYSHLHMEAIPSSSPAFEGIKAGAGGGTSWYRGQAPTLDLETVFGIERKTAVVGGHP